ncbi:MAG: NADP-dependent phosphogluconate dehydrogenase [Anaerolineae bacterium]|nr:NADP-dependent phosphogluconate dehydrogenase [Anaerolineae bacterium]
MTACDIGLIGLAVMGQNLALNMERNGFAVAVYNRTMATAEAFVAAHPGKRLYLARTLEELAGALQRPRRVMIMVKAGQPVDVMIEQLVPLLEPGDLIIDGGNSFFADTARRARELAQAGIHFIGAGISGGEEGALWGPSIMPGGDREAYALVEPIFRAIAAKANDGTPCVAYIGPGGAGHYVKMVHNGIEYGVMQLIAEAYDILRTALGLSAAELAAVFDEWNRGELASFLVEITADILKHTDAETGQPLVDVILDTAGQKGTGKWTSQSALDLGVATPTINAAVEARILSAMKQERIAAAQAIPQPSRSFHDSGDELIAAVRAALYASEICSYAQGMALLRAASEEYGYQLNLGEIAAIWRAGCIIRAGFLDDMRLAFQRSPDLVNLLLDPKFKDELVAREALWRQAVGTAIRLAIPVPAMSASLAYFDAYRSARLPANLIQAQRDYFGAHTYERVDRPGVYHTEWTRVKMG